MPDEADGEAAVSVVIGNFHAGALAKFALLKRDGKTKVDCKLQVEYFKGTGLFIGYWFTHEVHEGFKWEHWVGHDYFALSVDYVSIPSWAKSQLNISIKVTHIPENQELHTYHFMAHLPIEFPRLVDGKVFALVKNQIETYKLDILNAFKDGRLPLDGGCLTIGRLTRVQQYEHQTRNLDMQ